MSKLYLKIKIKSLAEEAKIIKKEEQKQRDFKRYSKDKQGLKEAHLEAEKTFFELKSHRIDVVRFECRAALLAYAYLRNKKYKDVEPNSKTNLQIVMPTYQGQKIVAWGYDRLWKRVARLIYKYNTDKTLEPYYEKSGVNLGSPMMKPEDLQNWLNDK